MKCNNRENISYVDGNYSCIYSSIMSINAFSVCYYCTYPKKDVKGEFSDGTG